MIPPSYFNFSCPDGNRFLYCSKPPQLSGGTLTSALAGVNGSEIDRYLNVEYTSKAGKNIRLNIFYKKFCILENYTTHLSKSFLFCLIFIFTSMKHGVIYVLCSTIFFNCESRVFYWHGLVFGRNTRNLFLILFRNKNFQNRKYAMASPWDLHNP